MTKWLGQGYFTLRYVLRKNTSHDEMAGAGILHITICLEKEYFTSRNGLAGILHILTWQKYNILINF